MINSFNSNNLNVHDKYKYIINIIKHNLIKYKYKQNITFKICCL